MNKALVVVSVLISLAACDKKDDTKASPGAAVSAGPGGAAVQAGSASVVAVPGAASVQAGAVSVTASADGGARVVVPGLGTIQAK